MGTVTDHRYRVGRLGVRSAAAAEAGYLVQGDARGYAGVEGLGGGVHRDACHHVAGLADEAGSVSYTHL